MKIIKLLLIPLILFSTAVQAQEVSYMGIIGKGQALGAKDSNDNVVPVLGIDSSNNTFLKARTGKALAFGNTAITGTLSVSGVTTLGSDIQYNDSSFYIYSASADGADNQNLILAAGGSNTEARGAHMLLAGNESASTGAMSFNGGNISSSNISFSINHASALIRFFNASGARIAYLNNSGDFNLDATNGGNVVLNKSGSAISIQENSSATACMGTSAPNGTTPVVVTTSCATSGARVFYSRNGAVTNNASISTTTAPNGTSFSFASTNGADTGGASVVWLIIKESA